MNTDFYSIVMLGILIAGLSAIAEVIISTISDIWKK